MIKGLEPVLRVVNSDGSYGRALNGWTKLTLGGDEGEAQVLKVEYNAQDPTYTRLVDQTMVVLLLGGAEYPDMRFLLDESDRDEVEDQDTTTWAGMSLLHAYLDAAVVYPQSYPSTETAGKQLTAQTAGQALGDLVDAAKVRGCFPALARDFTNAVDSSGHAWGAAGSTTEFLDQGTSYYDVVAKWASRKFAVAKMAGTTLQLYAYGYHGDDLTLSVVLRRGYELDEGPVSQSTRDRKSVLLAATPELGAIERSDASSLSVIGRREGYVAQTQVPDVPTLASIADGTLALTSRSRDSFTYGLVFGPSTRALPFKHYAQGDVVTLRVRGAERQLRLRTLSVVWDDTGAVTGSIGLGFKSKTPEDAVAELVDRLTAGSQDGGLYNTPPIAGTSIPTGGTIDPADPGGYDTVPPAAVSGLALANVFYDAAKTGQQQILATFTWNPVITNQDGSAINDLAYYQLSYYDPEWWGSIPPEHQGDYYVPTENTPADTTTRIVSGLLVGHSYHFRVRAIDFWGNSGPWSGADFTIDPPVAVPDQPPSAPVVDPVLFGALQVTWDGLEVAGAALDDDIRSVVVHVSTVTGFTVSSATVAGEIGRPAAGTSGSTVITDLTPGTTYYVKLQLKDAWGNVSTASAQASGVPADVSLSGAVGPENLTFDDFNNLVPDGGFERAAYRSTLVSQTSSDAVTWTNDALLSFPQNTGAHVLLDVASTATGQWVARSTSAGPTGSDTDGVYKDAGSGVRWGTSTDIAFDSTKLYRISCRMRVDRDATNGTLPKTAYVSAESKNASGFLNLGGANDPTNMAQCSAKARTMVQADGWRTWTGYVKGTAAVPLTFPNEGTVEAPLQLPTGTTRLGVQINMDWNDGAGKWHVGRTQISTIPVSFEGVYSAQLVGAGAGKYQRVVLATIPSGGGTEQYWIKFRARVVGALTTQPTVMAGVRILTADGSQVAVTALPSRSTWSNDGWVTIEGRVSRAPDAQYETARSAELYVGTYDLRATQQVQIDAVEIRQVATSVLIADAAITDAKIASLSASKITAGTISSAVLVSGSIATATSGARVTLDSSGLKAYNASSTQTVGINSDGTAFFSGTLGNTEVTGYVRALSGAKQVVMLPQGMTLTTGGGSTYPAVLTSPGFPFEQSMGFFGQGGSNSQPFGFFNTIITTSAAATENLPNGTRTGITLANLDAHPFPATATAFKGPIGFMLLDFPTPESPRLPPLASGGQTFQGVGGGDAQIRNHWYWPQYPPAYNSVSDGGREAGDEISFIGTTRQGQQAGMVISSGSSADKNAVTVDFRRATAAGTTQASAIHANHEWVTIRAYQLQSVVANVVTSDSRLKSDIEEIPYSAVGTILANPAKRWRLTTEQAGTTHLGPMADGLPADVASEDHLGTGKRGVRTEDVVGLLWKAVEEIAGRLEMT